AIAFKEWAEVCDALSQGRQSIIVRKGGISESLGAGVFTPDHSEFWLYPTRVHQAQQGVRIAAPSHSHGDSAQPDSITIRAFARIELIGYVRDEAVLPALEQFHVLTSETIFKRFHYRTPGLWVLGVRIWNRTPAYSIEAKPEHAGCRTWIILESELPTVGLTPALDDS